MGIKKYTSYILCIGLVLSSVGPLQAEQAGRADEAREKMNLFQRSFKSFRRTLDRYNRCIRGKCSDEEKQRIKKELKGAAKKTAAAGLVVAGIVGTVLLGGAALEFAKRKKREAFRRKSESPEEKLTRGMQGDPVGPGFKGWLFVVPNSLEHDRRRDLAHQLIREYGIQRVFGDRYFLIDIMVSAKAPSEIEKSRVTEKGRQAAATLDYQIYENRRPSEQEIETWVQEVFGDLPPAEEVQFVHFEPVQRDGRVEWKELKSSGAPKS